ncbi:MAG: hypothetical protein WC369_08095, partial [Dehalococcoidales bacterium]
QEPKEIVKATEGPANGVDVSIETMSGFSPGGLATLVIKTVPNAHVKVWAVNPSTGNRSAYPSDRIKDADADGIASWEWVISGHTASGEGHIELYITTSTDATVLAAFDANALEYVFTDRADDIAKFKKGLIEQIELDDYTTLKMFPVTYK